MLPRDLLTSGSQELGIELTLEEINSFFIYTAELKKWNKKINLTSITGERDTVIKHMLDSLAFLKGFHPVPGMWLLDMGSGAGFPAIPIKIVHPEISVTLVESVKKKGAFLRHIIRTLALVDIEVVDTRTENLSISHEAEYDVVTARAFAEMSEALRAGTLFLKIGGLMVLSRGPGETILPDELDKLGMTLERKTELTLPHSDYSRAIWVFKKSGESVK